MGRATAMGVCLTACVAAIGVASPVAFAVAPEFTTKSAIGNVPAAAVPFSMTSGAVTLQGQISAYKVQRAASTGVGEATGPKVTKKVVIVFSGCGVPSLGYSCEYRGPVTKEIETDVLEGELATSTKNVRASDCSRKPKVPAPATNSSRSPVRVGLSSCP